MSRPLTTTVIGSWSVPDWLQRAKTAAYHGGVSRTQLSDMHDMAIKAVLKDQEVAGIDVVTDGELRRDNDVDHLLARVPGVVAREPVKAFYFDYLDLELQDRIPAVGPGPLGLAADLAFTRTYTDRPVRFSMTGPFSLSRRLRTGDGAGYGDSAGRAELVLDLARVLNAEATALAAAGAELLQLDEPFLAGYPEHVELAIEAVNVVVADVPVTWALHVCYGNRYARPLWEGHYDFLFPAVLDARVDQLVLEFARKGDDDLPVIEKFGWDRAIGLGVIDVKSAEVETPDLVATRIRRALDLVPADRLVINPDCGLRHLTGPVARAKLAAMAQGAALVRAELRR